MHNFSYIPLLLCCIFMLHRLNSSNSSHVSVDMDGARSYLKLVKDRFNGKELDTYRRFIASVICCTQVPESDRNPSMLLSDVESMFAEHPDLIRKFRYFYNHRKNNGHQDSRKKAIVKLHNGPEDSENNNKNDFITKDMISHDRWLYNHKKISKTKIMEPLMVVKDQRLLDIRRKRLRLSKSSQPVVDSNELLDKAELMVVTDQRLLDNSRKRLKLSKSSQPVVDSNEPLDKAELMVFKDQRLLDNYRKRLKLSKSSQPVVDSNEPLDKAELDYALENFVQEANEIINDQRLLDLLVKKIRAFQKHRMPGQLKRDAFLLLEQYPELKIALSGFLVQAMKLKSTTQRQSKFKNILFECEDDVHSRDVLFHRLLFLKEAAERLVRENRDKKPREQIDVRDYFSSLDLTCIRDELDSSFRVLPDRFMSRAMALQNSMEIISGLDNKIRESKVPRIQEKKMLVKQELQIPVWNWHS